MKRERPHFFCLDYSPFGLTFNSFVSGEKNKYLYNGGAERQDELGVDLTRYRTYDPTYCRWWQVDPKADGLVEVTPYNYSFNNPIRWNDPEGDCPPGVDCSSYYLGLGASILDNMAGGLTNLREVASNYIDNGSSFNLGQDHGDITSIVVGAVMVDGGSAAATGGTAVLVGTGGTTAPISGGVALAGLAVAAEGGIIATSGAVNISSQKGRVNTDGKNTTEKQQNLNDAQQKGIPQSQLGPSGKPKIHNVEKTNMKSAKDAARNNAKSNSAPEKHSSDSGQKTHYHSTKNGEKMKGKDNVHYVDKSSKKND